MEEIGENGDTVRLNSFICLDSSRPFVHSSATSSDSSRRRSTPPISTKSPSRLPIKPSKRKQESRCYEPVYVENCLVQLCRGGMWEDVLGRCEQHPEEANLVLLCEGDNKNERSAGSSEERFHRRITRRVSNSLGQDDDPVLVFRETPLGIVCGSGDIGKSHIVPVVRALVKANPHQVGASQVFPGHTALRDAILTGSCTVQIFSILLEALSTCTDCVRAFTLKDRGGMALMEHLITFVQLGSSPQPFEMLKALFQMLPLGHQPLFGEMSPLIFLLTLGNSVGATTSRVDDPTLSGAGRDDAARLEMVLAVTKLLLDVFPSLLWSSSIVSGCSPLHVALRNYGTYEALIQELIHRDTSQRLMERRNMYGDLPLHVACSVGVPLKVLTLVLNETAKASFRNMGGNPTGSLDPLIWSTNNSGYTPIDLEWVRVIESGSDFLTARTFYPLEATGVRKHCFKQDEYYKDLLREAVDQLMGNGASEDESMSREEKARSTFGNSIDRISVIIKSAAMRRDSGDHLVTNKPADMADVCKLCRVDEPSLPLPILELFLWLRSDDILTMDHSGMIPLHHAMIRNRTATDNNNNNNNQRRNSKLFKDWQTFLVKLLDRCPEQSKVATKSGRLPLHFILDHTLDLNDAPSGKELGDIRHEIAEKLVEMYPEATDQRDPISGLYPFMMAAGDPNLPVNTVFCLLRHSPSQCLSNRI
jgi:hypothetical protein